VAEILDTALHEGRLAADEFDTRSRAAESAKTRAELARLHADLPGDEGDGTTINL
jgi:hypothetical protein